MQYQIKLNDIRRRAKFVIPYWLCQLNVSVHDGDLSKKPVLPTIVPPIAPKQTAIQGIWIFN